MTDYSIDIIKDTSYTIELNEQGPQGIQGEVGPVGPKGDKGDVGEKGDTGVSVVGVEEISKVGLVTTYRMLFSNGEYFDYQITDGSIDGLTRETIINIIGYEPASYTSVEGLTTRVSTLEERVEDLSASKFPNVVIIGTPSIEGGQVSGYSNTNYLQFPFVDISRGLPFDIYFSFTTGSDVVSQQNVLDSHFGIALAIQNSKGVMALSSNGTSWDIGNVTGTNTILPNTTYYAKCSWTGTQYNTSLSTNDTTYTPDMVLDSTLTTNKTTIFIGGSPNLFGEGTAHPFKGTINFNNSRVDVQGVTVWEGMADVGLASRANVSLNNLDEIGEKRFTDIQIALDGKQDKGETGSGLEVCDIGMALYVDETKGLRRYLNGQIVDINTNTQKFLDRLQEITTLYPSLLCTEEEWQTAKTLSAFGQVGKFIFNYADDGETVVSVRIPAIVNVQGLFDLQNLGMTVKAGLPNITGSVISSTSYIFLNNGASGAFKTVGKNSVGPIPSSNNDGNNIIDIDASRSSSIYGNSSTVQEEAIQYPYFIQIATGQETENNIVNEIELNTPSFFGDSKYVPTAVNNLSWLKSEGQNNPKGTYPSFYDWILENVNKGTKNFKGKKLYQFKGNTTETEGYTPSCSTRNPVVGTWFYGYAPIQPMGYVTQVNSDGSIVIHDNKVNRDFTLVYKQEIITLPNLLTDYDFYIDTDDETFRLPLKNGMEGMFIKQAPVTGNGMTLGLTNGAQNFSMVIKDNGTASNQKFFNTTSYGTRLSQNSINPNFSGLGSVGVTSDPTKSGLVADLSNVTVPQGYNLYYYVGETVQNSDLIDAGRIGEILPTKLDASKVKAYIVETYRNGSSWYRIYSDGWCEQGGLQSYQGAPYGLQTVTLLKPYIDTNYTVTANIVWGAEWFTNTSTTPNLASSTDVIGSITNRTKSSFDIQRLSTHFWKAEGYIA